MEKTFSLTAVALTSLVTFAISGVGGALFNRYLDRAQPFSYIQSVSFFASSDDSVIASEALLRASEKSGFTKHYLQQISADELETDYLAYSALLAGLKDLEARLAKWDLNGFRSQKEDAFRPSEIDQLPLLSDPYGRDFTGRFLGLIPIGEMDLPAKCTPLLDTSHTSGQGRSVEIIQLMLGNQIHTIQSDKPIHASERKRWAGFGQALSCGLRLPTADIVGGVIARLQSEIKLLHGASEALKQLLEGNSRMKLGGFRA